ncbi:MAG TPA: ribosomal RNA small subunit methyltransferase A, partial [Firmicutes bacterium]|nr:ribosomal RNA small subunit methyltransferase A [Bacillota bacterium]
MNDERVWKPRKSLGQNFLVDKHIAAKIVDESDIGSGETVLEIGPGRGALTGLLAERAHRVVAIEVDAVMVAHLQRHFESSNVTILHRDILDVDFAELGNEFGVSRWPIIGNLPYVISSRVAMNLVAQARSIARATIMVQREVGERYLAPPGSRDYGLLSVLLQATGSLSRGFRVGPGAFRPQPRIESIVLTWISDPPPDMAIQPLITTVKAAFAQRRKQLRNALRGIPGASDDVIATACAQVGIDLSARAE